MHFNKITYLAAFANSAFAGTAAPTGTTSVVAAPQSNYCGTNGMSYCCNGGNCSAMGEHESLRIRALICFSPFRLDHFSFLQEQTPFVRRPLSVAMRTMYVSEFTGILNRTKSIPEHRYLPWQRHRQCEYLCRY